MKKILIMLLICSSAASQTNFNVENGNIKWQKVYESDLSEQDIKQIMAKNAVLNKVSADLTGNSSAVDLDCEQSTPIYMRDNLTFFVNIEVKEGRYRVTVTDFKLIPSTTVKIFGVEETGNAVSLEDYQIRTRDGELRKNKMAENSRDCINKYLEELFRFKTEEDNW